MSEPSARKWVTHGVVAAVLLFLVSTINYADRTIMAVLQEPIKHDLKLTDWQLGLLAGPIFAIFYAFVGVPLARFAEKSSRKRIIVGALTVWSLITACCGLAQNFVQIALFRVGVGAAESGSPPASHSIVASYFSPTSRGRALAMLQLGVPCGVVVGSVTAGWVAHVYGWRAAFLALAIPGLLLALITAFVLREPARTEAETAARSSFWAGTAVLFRNPVFCLLLMAGALGGNASHGLDTFLGSFFVREHGLTMKQLGGTMALVRGCAGVTGSIVGGVLADYLSRRVGLRAYALVPGVAAVSAGLMFLAAFTAPSLSLCIAGLLGGYFFLNMVPSPSYAAVQNLVSDGSRATAAALYMFFVTVVGSIAPPLVGFVSDTTAGQAFPSGLGAFAASCPGGRAIAARAAEIGSACTTASAVGLKAGMMIPVGVLVVTLFVYLLVARGMTRAERVTT